MPRTTPMFRNDVLTHWTNAEVDAQNARNAQSRYRRSATARSYHLTWLVFADRIEPADLTNYTTASASAAHFSDDDFIGLANWIPVDGTFSTVTQPGRSPLRRGKVATLFDAACALREDFAAAVQEEERYNSDPLYALKLELASADWFCTFSDDGGVCRAGEAHFRKIRELVRKAGDAGQALYDDTERAVHAQSKTA